MAHLNLSLEHLGSKGQALHIQIHSCVACQRCQTRKFFPATTPSKSFQKNGIQCYTLGPKLGHFGMHEI